MALKPGVGLGLLYNMPPCLSVPCSASPFVYTHLSQVHGHVIQPPLSWFSSSSRCIQLPVQHIFWDFGVLLSFYMAKPSHSWFFSSSRCVQLSVQHIFLGFRCVAFFLYGQAISFLVFLFVSLHTTFRTTYFFGISVCCILSIWPSHLILWHLINLTMLSPLIMASNSSFCRIFFSKYA